LVPNRAWELHVEDCGAWVKDDALEQGQEWELGVLDEEVQRVHLS
jgi:hypothetical protein